MNNADLDLGGWKHRLYGIREALQTIHAGDEYILKPTALQFGNDLQPELSPLFLLKPNAQNVFGSV